MNNGDGNVIQVGWMLGIIGLMTMLYFMTTKRPWEPPGNGTENKAEV